MAFYSRSTAITAAWRGMQSYCMFRLKSRPTRCGSFFWD
jgi:hypothetical protein